MTFLDIEDTAKARGQMLSSIFLPHQVTRSRKDKYEQKDKAITIGDVTPVIIKSELFHHEAKDVMQPNKGNYNKNSKFGDFL